MRTLKTPTFSVLEMRNSAQNRGVLKAPSFPKVKNIPYRKYDRTQQMSLNIPRPLSFAGIPANTNRSLVLCEKYVMSAQFQMM